MAIEFTWEEGYSVGNEMLDQQHKRMFALGNSLSDNLDTGTINKTIMTLYKHVREHFDCEENHMQEIGYPDLHEHRELHNALIGNLNELAAQSFESPQSIFLFKKFIFDWVIDHIMNHDKDYFLFCKSKGN